MLAGQSLTPSSPSVDEQRVIPGESCAQTCSQSRNGTGDNGLYLMDSTPAYVKAERRNRLVFVCGVFHLETDAAPSCRYRGIGS